jgi:Lon protease-like protein
MRRDLPPRPHIDHLKKQAKDLLEAHKRGDPSALARIREAVPAFTGRSDTEIAQAAFALHDAQSAIAREYGFASWRQLRTEVAAAKTADTFSEANLRAIWQRIAPPGAAAISAQVYDAIRRALSSRQTRAATFEQLELPARLPLLAPRNLLLLPGSIVPFRVARPRMLAACDAAQTQSPSLLAVFAQRSEADDVVTFERLHPIGCWALVHASIPDADGAQATIVIEALGQIVLEGIESTDSAQGALFARVRRFEIDDSRDAEQLAALEQSLRDVALQLTASLPDPEQARAILETADEAGLANLVVANLPYSVAEKAAFAAEPALVERLRLAKQMIDRLSAQPG